MTKFRLCLVVLVCGLLLAACGPSPEQLLATETAIAATVVAQMTADAPTPTHTPTPTPRPTATPAPALYTGTARGYIPTQSEMPEGYQVRVNSSKPIGDVGYQQIYYSLARMMSGSDAVVRFVVTVHETEHAARGFYSRIDDPENFYAAMDLDEPLESAPVEMANADESTGFAASVATGVGTQPFHGILFRKRNVVAAILVGGIGSEEDMEQAALYYTSMVVDKLMTE